VKGGKRAFSERQKEGGLITILCSSLFSVGEFVIGFADLGTSPQTPGIYRFHAKTRFSRKKSEERIFKFPPLVLAPSSALRSVPTVALSSGWAMFILCLFYERCKQS